MYPTPRHCGAWFTPQGLTVLPRGVSGGMRCCHQGQVSAGTWGPVLHWSFLNYTLTAFMEAPNSQVLLVSDEMDLILLLVLCLGFGVRVMLITP